MVKLTSTTRHNPLNDTISTNENKSPSSNLDKTKESVSFTNFFKTSRVKKFDDSIQEIIEKVKQNGDAFLKHPEEENLNSYKESIKMFLKKLKDDFLSLKEEFGAKKNGEQKVYQILNSLETDVESLTKQTLDGNKAINLLCSLDEVRGLVLDILG
ncbi:MAG: DUF327 family protein [Candidatus Riflebacteria bacterium]|nr:DUF327 family protein [Candidatus Riflebacteria bacterium]